MDSRLKRDFPMLAISQKIPLALIVLASLAFASTAGSEEVVTLEPGFAMTKVVVGSEKTALTALIGNAEIADITFGPNNTFLFQGKKEGKTNVIVLNDRGAEVYRATIVVEASLLGQRVKIHNKKLITSYTIYRCLPAGCEYIDETAAKEPAPLPTGHTSSTLESNAPQVLTTPATPP